ncbi:DsbA family oxidoreductase [Pseudomonas sp. LFM046]|uniref:DsbA family oxidoreductase n=1 Tax=Pseudomonas sp. LFM046 TaxID=1608357 RepID=UPI0005CFC771|nr:DsbA family oxidoreductase [Pseudomonas sp. LFM046]
MKPLLVEMAFDFICPWCLIGKRNLQKALRSLAMSRSDVQVEVRWKGVQLLSHLPAQGVPFEEFYAERLGSPAAVRARQAQVLAAAEMAGVDLELHRIRVMPNTANAHRLFERAAQSGTPEQVDALLEHLFSAYFQLGADLGDRGLLLRVAESCGFDRAALEAVLRDDAQPYVGSGAMMASSVPAFVIDQRLSLVGAQPPEQILPILHRTLQHLAAAGECAS